MSTLLAKKRLDTATFPVYNGGLGENPIPVPSFIKEVVAKASTQSRYVSCNGSSELQNLFGTHRIVTGNALKELLMVLLLGFKQMHPNGTLVLVVPYWPTYATQARLLGIPIVLVRPMDTQTYKLQPQDLEKLSSLSVRPHLVILNNPNNPTGCHYTTQELQALVPGFTHLNSIVMADQIYQYLNHSGRITDFSTLYSNCVTGTSLSKSIGAGGWRWGRLVFSPSLDTLFQTCSNVASNMYSCPTAMFDQVDQLVIRQPIQIQNYLRDSRQLFRDAFQVIQSTLLSTTQIQLTPCEAAWYTLLNFEKYRSDFKFIGIENNYQLTEYLWSTYHIIMVAGTEFGFEEHELIVRWSFVDITPMARLTQTLVRIQELCTSFDVD